MYKRQDEPGRKGDRHAADFIQRRARFVQRGPRHLRDMLDVAAACNLRHLSLIHIFLIGRGVIFFIVGGVNWGSMEKLLHEGDYTRTKKKTSSSTGVVSTVYWCVAAAVYLAGSLPGHSWRESWVIWLVAGVLFAAVMAVCLSLIHI